MPRASTAVFVRDLEKSRQSDAECAARPSRSAEARSAQCEALHFRLQGGYSRASTRFMEMIVHKLDGMIYVSCRRSSEESWIDADA